MRLVVGGTYQTNTKLTERFIFVATANLCLFCYKWLFDGGRVLETNDARVCVCVVNADGYCFLFSAAFSFYRYKTKL